MTLFKFVTSRRSADKKKGKEDTTRGGHLFGITPLQQRSRTRSHPGSLPGGIRGPTHTKGGEKDTEPMMTMMASERVKLPVTVPANWSDYTVLSLSAYYLRILHAPRAYIQICKSKERKKNSNNNKYPMGIGPFISI